MNAASVVNRAKTIEYALSILATLNLTAFQFPPQAQVENGSSFDFIIVGGGTAGAVVANRLTEIPSINVLLIEAGGDPPIESDLASLMGYMKNGPYDWDYESDNDHRTQQCHVKNTVEITNGKMLGGSSSINGLLYNRGNPRDYHRWAVAANDSDWEFENIFKYFTKSERLTDDKILNSPDRVFHGTDGYLGITKYYYELNKNYLDAFKELGYDSFLDPNGDRYVGFSEPVFTIADGVRQSTAVSFLSSILGRPNLYVLKNTLVTKINFDEDKNATGVEALTENNKKYTFKATREVIVSAGGIKTPQLLMLSGIGPKKQLRRKNIPVLVDLPVGKNYQNDISIILAYAMEKLNKTSPAKDPRIYPFPMISGYLALNRSQIYPDYEVFTQIMSPDSLASTCAFSQRFDNDICDYYIRNAKNRQICLMTVTLIQEKSRGDIQLRTTNPRDPPKITTGFFTNEVDLQNFIKYTKNTLPIVNTTYFKSVNAELLDPMRRRCGRYYDVTSDEYWQCYIMCMMSSQHHYCGTCPMGSVVNSRLQVYGVQRLRVVDASIMPEIPSAHTYGPIVMIADKASDMIKEDNGLMENSQD